MTQKVMTKEELESKENDLVILPDLYIRKLRIIEKVHNLRRSYLPRQNHIAPNINLKDERQFTQWDYVLQEIKWMAYDFKHERKYKIAVAYHCSRRIMKQHKQEEVYNKELILYHKLVSHEMAEMVRSEFQNLNKETKEIEIERIPLENELSNAQNDVDVLDLDMELKEKPISSLTPNNLSALQSNFNNNTTSNLKKHATSIQLSTFSIPSSKIKKKGNNNLHKTSVFPAPVIKKQPLLIEFMKRTVECIGIQPLEQCCQVEKAQFYEKLAKLFKRFPKKTQHLKSNVPDIFTNSGNIPQTTPIISSFEDNLKGTPNSWNPVIENSGHKKRKKTTFKEEGLRGGSKFQMGELKKGLDFLNFKKLKNPENFDEILTMFYNDHKIGEGDYQKIFQNSLEAGANFPKSWEEVPTLKFHEILFEKEFRYCEKVFDEEFEKNNDENLIMLDDFVESLGGKMERYFSNRRQLINCDNSTIRRFFEKDEISNSDLVFSFPKLQKNLLVTYSKESNHSSKFKLFKENIQNNPNFAENSIILEAHLTRKWPIIFHFLLDFYFNLYGNKWNLISDAMNINIISKNFMLTDEVCETKWISFFSRKTTTKLIDQQSKMIPQKTKFFTKLDEQSEKEIEEEEEPNTYTKRKSVFKKMRERKEINYLEDEYQKFKDLNQKFEKKDFFLPIYPNEKAVLIFDNLKNDRLKEKQKDILEMMDVVPGKKHQTGQDIQMSGNKFATYETFLSENESKLKTSLMNINPFIFNTKRKRYISEKVIGTLVKLIVDSKHQQQMRQYSAPNQIPGPNPNPNPQYMSIPPHYAPKIPPNHPMNGLNSENQQQPNPMPPNPQNYPIHSQMNPQHMPPNNMHMMNMRSGPEGQFTGPPPSRNYNYMTAPPNPKSMMQNSRPPQQQQNPMRMNGGQEYMQSNGMVNMPNNLQNNNMNNINNNIGGGMAMSRENSRSNVNLRYVGGPNMTGVNMNNGVNGVIGSGGGANRSNVYQLNQINTVNNIKNEQLKMVKKPKN